MRAEKKDFYSKDEAMILFDGICNLCNGFVQFVLRRDPKKYFRFGSLQSDKATEVLTRFQWPLGDLKSIVLIEDRKLYTESTAALRICRKLNGGWPLLYGFIIVPKFIRDAVYRLVARNRYRWFGKRDACMLPEPQWNDRFM